MSAALTASEARQMATLDRMFDVIRQAAAEGETSVHFQLGSALADLSRLSRTAEYWRAQLAALEACAAPDGGS